MATVGDNQNLPETLNCCLNCGKLPWKPSMAPQRQRSKQKPGFPVENSVAAVYPLCPWFPWLKSAQAAGALPVR
jgi:hypothetical protein